MGSSNEIDIVVDSPKKVVSFKLDVDIISKIDEVWPRLGYRSRSQFLREAVIFYLQYVQTRGLSENSVWEHEESMETGGDDLTGEIGILDDLVTEIKKIVKSVNE